MDDQFLMGVADGRADGEEELDAFRDTQLQPVTELIDGLTVDILHHQVRLAAVGGAAVEKARDMAVVERR